MEQLGKKYQLSITQINNSENKYVTICGGDVCLSQNINNSKITIVYVNGKYLLHNKYDINISVMAKNSILKLHKNSIFDIKDIYYNVDDISLNKVTLSIQKSLLQDEIFNSMIQKDPFGNNKVYVLKNFPYYIGITQQYIGNKYAFLCGNSNELSIECAKLNFNDSDLCLTSLNKIDIWNVIPNNEIYELTDNDIIKINGLTQFKIKVSEIKSESDIKLEMLESFIKKYDNIKKILQDPNDYELLKKCKILRCGHSFNENSINKMNNAGIIMCSICRQPTNYADIVSNYALNNIIDQLYE